MKTTPHPSIPIRPGQFRCRIYDIGHNSLQTLVLDRVHLPHGKRTGGDLPKGCPMRVFTARTPLALRSKVYAHMRRMRQGVASWWAHCQFELAGTFSHFGNNYPTAIITK